MVLAKWMMVDCISNCLCLCFMPLISILMEINWILKMMVFGSNLSTDDVINLMFEAPRGKPMTMGRHNHQGV